VSLSGVSVTMIRQGPKNTTWKIPEINNSEALNHPPS
jgi:hypothetical protein